MDWKDIEIINDLNNQKDQPNIVNDIFNDKIADLNLSSLRKPSLKKPSLKSQTSSVEELIVENTNDIIFINCDDEVGVLNMNRRLFKKQNVNLDFC